MINYSSMTTIKKYLNNILRYGCPLIYTTNRRGQMVRYDSYQVTLPVGFVKRKIRMQ